MEHNIIGQFIKEIKIQALINHSHIIKLYSIFNDLENVYLLMEFCYGGIFIIICRNNIKLNKERPQKYYMLHVRLFGSFVIIRLFTGISNPKILSFVSVWPKIVIWDVRQRLIRIWGRQYGQYVDSSLHISWVITGVTIWSKSGNKYSII